MNQMDFNKDNLTIYIHDRYVAKKLRWQRVTIQKCKVTGILLVGKQESKVNLRPEWEQVWGVDCKFKDSDLTEEFHLKFIKETLGVHCKASNVGCRAELNRHRGRI